MLGQWGHSWPDQGSGAAKRNDWADIVLAWFDHYLKGRRDVDLGAVAEVQDSSGKWRNEESWPPAGEATTFHLTTTGGLSSMASADTAAIKLVPDPGHTQSGYQQSDAPEPLSTGCAPPVCALFTTPALPSGLRLAGLPRVRLTVTPSAPEGQLAAYLYSVTGTTARRIGWGQVDLRFPDGAVTDQPKATPVVPGAQMTVDLPAPEDFFTPPPASG